MQFLFFINFYWSKKGNISYKIESAERAPRERRESTARAPHHPECNTQIFLESLATVVKRLNRSYYIESGMREVRECCMSTTRAAQNHHESAAGPLPECRGTAARVPQECSENAAEAPREHQGSDAGPPQERRKSVVSVPWNYE